MTEAIEVAQPEPFQRFADFMQRYARDEGFLHEPYIPASHLQLVRAAAREMGVIFHDNGTMELIKQ